MGDADALSPSLFTSVQDVPTKLANFSSLSQVFYLPCFSKEHNGQSMSVGFFLGHPVEVGEGERQENKKATREID